MATSDLTGAPKRADHPTSAMSENDRRAHAAASYVRTPRVAAIGVISRGSRTITTVRTPDGFTGTVTAVAR